MKNVIRRLFNGVCRLASRGAFPGSEGLTREKIAGRYLKGNGIEIGALHKPLRVPPAAKVKYLDRMSSEALRKHYPELNDVPLVPVDIIDDGETLSSIDDQSLDFVIANHFLEHCQNPIDAAANMIGKLRKNGVLYMAVPDKRFSFDRGRPITGIGHLVKDFEEGPEWSRRAAFEEYVKFADRMQDETEAKKRVAYYMDIDYSIHYHVWTEFEIMELIVFLRKNLDIPFDVELVFMHEAEVIVILRKNGAGEDTKG